MILIFQLKTHLHNALDLLTSLSHRLEQEFINKLQMIQFGSQVFGFAGFWIRTLKV